RRDRRPFRGQCGQPSRRRVVSVGERCVCVPADVAPVAHARADAAAAVLAARVSRPAQLRRLPLTGRMLARVPARRLTTVPHDFRATTEERLARWREWGDVVDRRAHTRGGLVARIARDAGRYDALLLNGSVGRGELYSDLIAAAAAAHRPHGPRVVISEATWKR